MLQRIHQLRRYRSYLNTFLISPFVAREAVVDVHEARRLHAQIYLNRGYIAAHDIDSNGFISIQSDPYGAHARYFSVMTKSTQNKTVIVAAARLIEVNDDKGHDSFQTWREQDLTLAAKELIMAYDPRECVELSALVKKDNVSTQAVLVLYRALWQYSLSHGHKLWIISCDDRLLKRLIWLFGSAIQPIGNAVYFKGHTIVPVIINIQLSLEELLRKSHRFSLIGVLRRDVARFFLYDLSATALSQDQKKYASQLKARIV